MSDANKDNTERVKKGSLTGSRRKFLGVAALLTAGVSNTERVAGKRSKGAVSKRKHRGEPWAPKHHDHSGKYGCSTHLGTHSPVESISVEELSATKQGNTVYIPSLEEVSGSGIKQDPYTSSSGTAGMQEGFERLNEYGGGVIYYPSGHYGDGSTSWEIDLAQYENVRNNWAIYGDGLESSRIHCGSDSGNGIRISDSAGTATFYSEIVGVRFEGECSGYTFVWGSDDLRDAYNSCWTRFSTSNGDPAGSGACQLNFLLNTYHYGVHNAAGGVGLDLQRVQFSGLEGSYSSGESSGDIAVRLREYSFSNNFRYVDIEATYDGIHISDSRAIYNTFQNAYFANVFGTCVVQHVDDTGDRFPEGADQGTYFYQPFIGTVNSIVDLSGGTLYVNGSSKKWPEYTEQAYRNEHFAGSYSETEYIGYTPRSEPPTPQPGKTALSDGTNWDPDGDGTAELLISNGEDWIEIVDLGKGL